MKQIVLISGKGGTGKTFLSASFACLSKNSCFVDCDVDAANLYILLKPEIKVKDIFKSGKKPFIKKELCNKCGKCYEICRFDAIIQESDGFDIDNISCEGCGFCKNICPLEAIVLEESISGEWFVSSTKYGPFVYAKLGIGEENSGKLVSKIRQISKEIAQKEKLDFIIIDGPPGIGCPVISSLSGVDLAVVVVEPTLSGIYDMKRIISLAKFFKVSVKVVINKYDINLENSNAIENYCKEEKIPLAGKIPYSKEIIKSVVAGVPFVEFSKGKISKEVSEIWKNVLSSF